MVREVLPSAMELVQRLTMYPWRPENWSPEKERALRHTCLRQGLMPYRDTWGELGLGLVYTITAWTVLILVVVSIEYLFG